MLPVVDHPGQVAGSEGRIEYAVERRGCLGAGSPKDLLGTDQQVIVAVETEVPGHP
jgi:hypothetical protein